MPGAEDYWATMLASATSGMVARIPFHPIDTIKAKLQVDQTIGGMSKDPRRIKNIADGVRKIWMNEGLRGFYRGIGVAFFGSGPAACLYFTSYEMSRDFLTHNFTFLSSFPFLAHFTAGMFAETFSCVLWVPIDVIKERMQIQGYQAQGESWAGYYRNTVDATRQILRHESVRGIYRGYGATIASFGPFSALYFLFYEQFKKRSRRLYSVDNDQALPYWCHLASGASAGACASWLTNPLDLAKLRLQVQRSAKARGEEGSAPFNYRHTAHALQEIATREGVRGLFRGSVARVLFHTPATAVTVSLVEQFKKVYLSMLSNDSES
eukprot:gb/GECG01015716.1/.p1 GENE.gb/GECG01015716.1/~~gb/GECG01015716.1/.p1  ORF type:complete len:323 (+),score=27.91 gb/GECG01015716.1/:1-969(+)